MQELWIINQGRRWEEWARRVPEPSQCQRVFRPKEKCPAEPPLLVLTAPLDTLQLRLPFGSCRASVPHTQGVKSVSRVQGGAKAPSHLALGPVGRPPSTFALRPPLPWSFLPLT